MGYTYEKNYQTGRWSLCCQICGKAGGVRKHRCPYEYCPSLALCTGCAKTHKPRSENHQRCKTADAEFQKEKRLREALLNNGYYVRTAAVGDNGVVKVWFKNGEGAERQYHMAKETYRSIELITPATIEDYMEHGELTEIAL